MELSKIISNKELLNNIETDDTGSWQNDGIGPYEYWGAKGFDKGVDYFEYEGGFSFEFPTSLLPTVVDGKKVNLAEEVDYLNDLLEDEDVPDFILDDCSPCNVNECPNFKMVATIKDGIVYVEGELLDTDFSAPEPDYDF